MILDCGGGTVDIVIHRMLADGEQQSIMAPRGGPWGSTFIDKAFVAELASVFGADLIAKFKAHESLVLHNQNGRGPKACRLCHGPLTPEAAIGSVRRPI